VGEGVALPESEGDAEPHAESEGDVESVGDWLTE